jgi:acetylornithine deacetylase/succinyl-diaminopimelate desuccinylase
VFLRGLREIEVDMIAYAGAIEYLRNEISEIDPARIAAGLVKIPSYSDMPAPEREVASSIAGLLDREGFDVEIREAAPGRVNVLAELKGDEGLRAPNARSLMLCGHTDTVPAYDMADPLSGRVTDGMLHGRGSVDMKGPLASMAAALIALKRTGLAPAGGVRFAAVCDEEETGLGAADIVRRGPRVDGVIVGEPTSLIPCIGQKGLEWIRVRVIGKKTHGGNAAQGVNAIAMAARFIDRVYRDYAPVLNARAYPPLGAPTINVGRIEGGDQPSTVPGVCEILLDRRCVPTETVEQVYGELRDIAEGLRVEDPKFRAEIFPMDEAPLRHLPFVTGAGDPLVAAAVDARAAIGIDAEHPAFPQTDGLSVFPAWTDAGFLANYTDSSCIILGPGDLGVAHSAEEQIAVAEMERAALLYALTAMIYCNDER